MAGLAVTTAQAVTQRTLTFNGHIDSVTCNLAAGDVNRTITLPPVKVSDFNNSSQAGVHSFELTANCDAGARNVFFLFRGTQSTGDPALFANTGTSRGTALQLSHRNVAYIPANGSDAQRTRQVAIVAGKAVLPMNVNYAKTGATITGGTLSSIVTVSITYN